MLPPNEASLLMNCMRRSKRIAIPFCLLVLTACTMTEQRTGETSLKSGDTVLLNEDLTTPRGKFHLKFQHGEIKQKIKAFSNNCTIESRYKGPITYTSGLYTVTRVEYGEEFFSDGGATVEYSTTFDLEAQAATDDDKNRKLKLRCQVLDSVMMHHIFPATDIEQVMGDFMDFNTVATTPSPAQHAEPGPLPEQPSDQSSSNPATASP